MDYTVSWHFITRRFSSAVGIFDSKTFSGSVSPCFDKCSTIKNDTGGHVTMLGISF